MAKLEQAEAGFGFAANLERSPHLEVALPAQLGTDNIEWLGVAEHVHFVGAGPDRLGALPQVVVGCLGRRRRVDCFASSAPAG